MLRSHWYLCALVFHSTASVSGNICHQCTLEKNTSAVSVKHEIIGYLYSVVNTMEELANTRHTHRDIGQACMALMSSVCHSSHWYSVTIGDKRLFCSKHILPIQHAVGQMQIMGWQSLHLLCTLQRSLLTELNWFIRKCVLFCGLFLKRTPLP